MQRIERLSRRHHRDGFDCGNPELNDYLRHTARQHTDKGLSRTDVLVDDEAPTEVLGYVTVCLAEIITDSLPPQYGKKYPAKAHGVKLARLAIARSRQCQGLGALMMIHAMRKGLSGRRQHRDHRFVRGCQARGGKPLLPAFRVHCPAG